MEGGEEEPGRCPGTTHMSPPNTASPSQIHPGRLSRGTHREWRVRGSVPPSDYTESQETNKALHPFLKLIPDGTLLQVEGMVQEMCPIFKQVGGMWGERKPGAALQDSSKLLPLLSL